MPVCRFAEVAGPSFYVSFLGQDSLNGPLTINVTFDPSLNREAVFVDVFYWDRSELLCVLLCAVVLGKTPYSC